MKCQIMTIIGQVPGHKGIVGYEKTGSLTWKELKTLINGPEPTTLARKGVH